MELVEEFEEAVVGVEDVAVRRILQAMDSSYRSLVTKIAAEYDSISDNISLLPAQRQLLITEQLGDLLAVVNPSQEKEYKEMFADLISTVHGIGEGSVEEVIKNIDPDFKASSFARLPQKAMAIAATGAYDRLKRYGDDFALQATQLISQGLIQGWGNKKIAAGLKKIMEITRSKAEMIARTESANATVGAAKERYRKSGIDYVIWTTAMKEVCPWCVWKSGKIFKIEEVVIPQHPWCRCSIIPVTPQWARDSLLDFEGIEKHSVRVRSNFNGKLRSDKAPFEVKAPEPITLEQLKNV